MLYTPPTSGRLAVCGAGVSDDSRWSIYIVGVDISALVGGHHHQSPPPASPVLQHNGIDAIGAMRGEDVNSNILLSSTPYFCLRLLDFIQMREDALMLEPELVSLDQGIRVP